MKVSSKKPAAIIEQRSPFSRLASELPDASRTLTEKQAAEFLNIKSVKTLYLWRRKRKGPRYIKYERSIRYLRDDLISFQNASAIEPDELRKR